MMEFTIYKNKYHNCRNATISAMLKRLGVKLDYLWYQAGLYYKELPEKLVFSPYYRELPADFKQNHGINYNEEFVVDVNEFTQKLIHLVKSGHHTAIMVDIFHLPYSFYYNQNHDFHDIEVIEIRQDKAIICDHYYQYYGELSIADIRKAINSTKENFGFHECILYYFTLNDYSKNEYNSNDLLKVVKDNKYALLGEKKDDFSYFYGVEDSITGIQTLPIIYNKILSIFKLPQNEANLLLSEIYKEFKDISNSRYNLYIYLKNFSKDTLSKHFFELSQKWGITANLILRASLSQDITSLKDKVLKYILEIEQYEKMSVIKLDCEIQLLSN
ncbi:BtrH N-terminal domain-containing protein [Cytobacillus purgationiresistens]|uniref:Butirosin biosynthesis protein H N-terminal domain-containing protein n=1 Tax=Cytobacillus purgationiresistens TaxID=863449 RepID=A0ABU0ANV2_9BACI|nr:BtrH N-terminal domain-containing protein [Cytobacillus purgationiresistens]MDQ0272969.1 hypothetical protein [Cytobacillus purgationiresistens]